MNYTATDFLRKVALLCGLDAERITYLSFLTQYSIYNLGLTNIAIKYMHAGQPITRLKFYIGHKFIIQTDLPDLPELIGTYRLPPPVKDRIFNVWVKYHDEPTQKLRHIIRKKLRLIPIEKHGDYLGMDVDHYLTTEVFKIVKKEV